MPGRLCAVFVLAFKGEVFLCSVIIKHDITEIKPHSNLLGVLQYGMTGLICENMSTKISLVA